MIVANRLVIVTCRDLALGARNDDRSPRGAVRVGQVVIDTQRPTVSAAFWGALLRSRWGLRPDGWAWVESTPRLAFQPVSQDKSAKTPVHLDLECRDLDGEGRRAVQLGARVITSFHDAQGEVTVMADPEGLEFCLTRPRPDVDAGQAAGPPAVVDVQRIRTREGAQCQDP